MSPRNLLPVVLSCAVWVTSGICAEESPPFVGIVTGDRVRVRAEPRLSSEVLLQLSKGAKVHVLTKEGSWYGIELPPETPVYVAKSFISLEGTEGRVQGGKVRVRGGPGQAYAALGFLEKDQRVKIRKATGDWIEISPPSSCKGWVNESYLTFLEYPDDHNRAVQPASTEGSQDPGSQTASERR